MGLFSKRPEPADFTSRSRNPEPFLPQNERQIDLEPMQAELLDLTPSPESAMPLPPPEPPPQPQPQPQTQPQAPPQPHVVVHPLSAIVSPVVGPVPSLPPPLPNTPKFGIDDAVRLLRELPARDHAVVRDAVQRTLAHMNVDLPSLIEEATDKAAQLEARAMSIELEVERHEALALAAKKELAQIVTQRAELEATKVWMSERAAPKTERIARVLNKGVRADPS